MAEPDTYGTIAATEDLIADEPDAIATHALRVVFYLDAEGVEMYSFAHEGQASLSQWLGCIELLKEDLISELRGNRSDSED